MKGKISLKDFISEVKRELQSAQVPKEEGFFVLEEVNLEVEFTLEVGGGGKVELSVWGLPVKGSAEVKGGGHQTHKVSLKLTPLRKDKESNPVTEKSTSHGEPVVLGTGLTSGRNPIGVATRATLDNHPAVYEKDSDGEFYAERIEDETSPD